MKASNLTGSSNLVLDTWTYEVEFNNGDVTEFTANMIAHAMYAQCNVNGNQYLLLDQLVDHQKDDTAITLKEQTVHHALSHNAVVGGDRHGR